MTKPVAPQLYQWRKRRAPLRVPPYEVKCDCGTVKITKAKLLRNGSVKAVGAGDIRSERVLHPAIGRMVRVLVLDPVRAAADVSTSLPRGPADSGKPVGREV